MVLVALLYALLASTFILAKNALAFGKPFFLIGFRMILAGTLLIAYQTFRHGIKIKKGDWLLFLQTALFHIYLSFMLEFWALQYLSALKTTIIYSATPFVSALLSYWLLKERLTNKKLLGIAVGLGGMLPVMLAQATYSNLNDLCSFALPEIVLCGAVISGAYAWFIVRKLMHRGYSLVTINGLSMLIGGIGSFLSSIAFEGRVGAVSDWPQFLVWVLALILVANIIVYNFYGYLIRRYSLTFVSFAGFLCPAFATCYDWLFLGGTLSWHYLISLALVTLGLYLFYQDELKRVN